MFGSAPKTSAVLSFAAIRFLISLEHLPMSLTRILVSSSVAPTGDTQSPGQVEHVPGEVHLIEKCSRRSPRPICRDWSIGQGQNVGGRTEAGQYCPPQRRPLWSHGLFRSGDVVASPRGETAVSAAPAFLAKRAKRNTPKKARKFKHLEPPSRKARKSPAPLPCGRICATSPLQGRYACFAG
jgi:hypothetical protein